MHKPKLAPLRGAVIDELFQTATANPELLQIALTTGALDDKGKYIHWDKLRHKTHPQGLSSTQWWAGLKLSRTSTARKLILQGNHGLNFHWNEPPMVQAALHWLDLHAAGELATSELRIRGELDEKRYLVRSLIEEAISSSQLEGASTTLLEAKEMIRENRAPQNKDEIMIVNNYAAMNFVSEYRDTDVSPQLICELHALVTQNTLEDESQAGRFRRRDDVVTVVDQTSGDVLHHPPDAELIPERLQYLCDFANGVQPQEFVHPVIRAIVVHFLLAYDHPFVDGNGRTARALFYWVMMKNDYWLMRYITISKIIKRAPRQYGLAFLHTETDENDMTYFILHQLDVVRKAIDELKIYIQHKRGESEKIKEALKHNAKLSRALNYRQIALLQHALQNPRHAYVIEDHMRSHGVVYETARQDLLNLVKLKLLVRTTSGRTQRFLVPKNLLAIIEG